MEEQITITKTQLAQALAQWEADARADDWPDRDDDDRHTDNANYLFDQLKEAGAE